MAGSSSWTGRTRKSVLVTAATVSLVATSLGGTAGAVGADPKPPSPGHSRSKVGPNPGDKGKKAPTHPEAPGWVKDKVAKSRWSAPGQVRRGAVGMVPPPSARWTYEGSGDGLEAAVQATGGRAAPHVAAPERVAAVDPDEAVAAPGLGVQAHYGMEEFTIREGLSVAVKPQPAITASKPRSTDTPPTASGASPTSTTTAAPRPTASSSTGCSTTTPPAYTAPTPAGTTPPPGASPNPTPPPTKPTPTSPPQATPATPLIGQGRSPLETQLETWLARLPERVWDWSQRLDPWA